MVKPVIKIQSIWPAIKDDPESFYELFSPLVDGIASNPLIDYLHRDKGIEYLEGFTCPVLWQRLVIGFNGNVMLCSNDEMEDHVIGNAAKESIYDIWHGKKLNEARKIQLEKRGVEMLEPCRYCYYPRKTIPSYVLVGKRMVRVDDYSGRNQKIGK